MSSRHHQKTRDHNVLLIGAGPHARKVYIPWLAKNGPKYGANLKAVVDLQEQLNIIRQYLSEVGLKPTVLAAPAADGLSLAPETVAKLNRLTDELDINAVIISTEPSAHAPYAMWALQKGLSVLMDKPITARKNSANDPKAALDIVGDYLRIAAEYVKARKKKSNLLFSVSSQRRYHIGLQKVFEQIEEVKKLTNCPVTSIRSSHADGQWRFPDELIDITYHGFTDGYGKASHSGYHFFDLISELVKKGTPAEKYPDKAEIASLFSMPKDLLTQFGVSDYSRVFSEPIGVRSEQEIMDATKQFGEIDAYSLIALKRSDKLICTVQLGLQHNSFSRRSWIQPNQDLYKGNGRAKHEHHTIQQGPFQTIQVHSYQLLASKSDIDDYDLGGRNHFDIYIFRNADLLGGKHLEKISVKDMVDNTVGLDLLTEIVKSEIIDEFFSYLSGHIDRSLLKSDLLSHCNSVNLMAGIYMSHINRGQNFIGSHSIDWQ